MGDVLFEQVKKAVLGKVDPDAIEMARFSIAHPLEASVVYTRAGTQDIPFFALVGAVKAAKNQNLPGIGVFTFDKCLLPLTSFHAVYAKADSFVSDAEGRAITAAAVSHGSPYATEYLKAQTEAAKKEIIDKFGTGVSYFADINTICVFAFKSDLKMEKDLHRVASETSKLLRQAFDAFKSGDVVAGTAALIKLGVGEQVVCEMVDTAVTGGVIGRTPILGDLAKGACAGFVGNVIDGIHGFIKGGVGLAEAGVEALKDIGGKLGCAVWSIVGSGCSSAPPPPTAFSNATAYCANKGGMLGVMSKPNQPNDYSVSCHDGSTCKVKPGVALCATGAEKAANHDQRVQLAEAEHAQKMPQWLAEFDQRWMGQCPSEKCRQDLSWIRLFAKMQVDSAHKNNPADNFWWNSSIPFMEANFQAARFIQQHRYVTLPEKWGTQFVAAGVARCKDEQCRDGIKFVEWQTRKQIVDKANSTPVPPYDLATTPLYASAQQKAKQLFAESDQRAAQANPGSPADAWGRLLHASWSKQCADARCIGEITTLVREMSVAAATLQRAKPNESALSIQGEVNRSFGPRLDRAVKEAAARSAARMPALARIVLRRPDPPQPWLKQLAYDRPAWTVDSIGRAAAGKRPVPILRKTSETPRPSS